MNDLIDIRTPLAASKNARVELATLHPEPRPPSPAPLGHEGVDKAEASAEVHALPVKRR